MRDHPPPPKSKGRSPRTTHLDPDVLERKQRKREIDRRSQQNARDRIKSRIVYLEGIIENTKAQDGNGRTKSLIDQLSAVQEERDRLTGTIADVRRLVELHGKGDQTVSTSSDLTSEIATTGSLETPDHNEQSRPSEGDGTSVDLAVIPHAHPPYARPTTSRYLEQCECGLAPPDQQTDRRPSLWRYTDRVFSEHFRTKEPIDLAEDALREDTFVRALVHGWSSIGPVDRLPLSWRILRRIDEHYFSMCSNVERLAAMFAFYPYLQYHREQTQERRNRVPKWMLKKPSSLTPYSYVVNFVVWPGARDLFAANEHAYCSSTFLRAFREYFHILWPYEFRDTHKRNVETDEYSISGLFVDHVNDLRNWTMGSDFFEMHPEFGGHIPFHNRIPTSLWSLQGANGLRALPNSNSSSTGVLGSVKRRSDQLQISTHDQDGNDSTEPVHAVVSSAPSTTPVPHDYPSTYLDPNAIFSNRQTRTLHSKQPATFPQPPDWFHVSGSA